MQPTRFAVRAPVALVALLSALAGMLPCSGGRAAETEGVYRLRRLDETAGTLRDEPDGPARLFGAINWQSSAAPVTDEDAPRFDRLFRQQSPPKGEAVEVLPVAFSLLPKSLFLGGRIRGEWADDFDGDTRAGGRLLLNTRSFLAFNAEANRRRTVLGGRRHEFWNGDANVLFWLPEVKRFAMRTGGGAAWIHADDETEVGWNVTYAADVFIKKPWLLSGELDFGKIGEDKLFHGQATIGLRLHYLEVYTGYDYFDLGSLQVDGFIGGAGFWF